jgi:hypothetical protein
MNQRDIGGLVFAAVIVAAPFIIFVKWLLTS